MPVLFNLCCLSCVQHTTANVVCTTEGAVHKRRPLNYHEKLTPSPLVRKMSALA